jgi:hypothetical protein
MAAAGLAEAYGQIVGLLGRLPLPIRIPSLRGSVYCEEVGAGLVRAYAAVQDLPMDATARRCLCVGIDDWLVAVEWLFRDAEDEACWHLDLIEVQLSRVLVGLNAVDEALSSLSGRP